MKYLHKGERPTGFALPLLSLNTDKGPCGEFPDIASMARLAKSRGMNLLGDWLRDVLDPRLRRARK